MSEHVRMFIGGEWSDAEDGATFEGSCSMTRDGARAAGPMRVAKA